MRLSMDWLERGSPVATNPAYFIHAPFPGTGNCSRTGYVARRVMQLCAIKTHVLTRQDRIVYYLNMYGRKRREDAQTGG